MAKTKPFISQEITWLLNEKYGGKITGEATADIERIKAGEPVDYVIGYKNFLECKIDLRYKPLIPRDETEFWVKQAIGSIKGREPISSLEFRVLDMFSGSGCCGIALLKHIENSHCDFVDIDTNCIKQIKFNLKLNGIDKKRYRVIKSDVLEKIKDKYDIILANPPYISIKRKSAIQKSALNFEPKIALLAKNNGMFFIKEFLKQVQEFLNKYGMIYMEFDSPQKKDIEKLLKESGYKNFEFKKDQFNKWRFLKIVKIA